MTLRAAPETILAALPDLIFQIDREGVVRGFHANDPEHLFAAPDQIVGAALGDLLPPPFAASCLPLIERALEERALQVFEYSLPFPDGERWYEARITPAGDAEVLAIVRDVTPTKLAFRAVERSERRFASLVQGIDAIVWEGVLEELRFTFVSDRAEKLLGYPLARWYEAGFWLSIIHPADREATVRACALAALQTADHELEYRVVAADGRVVWLHDVVRVATHADEYARGVMVDITTQKNVEADRHRIQQQALWSQKLESMGLLAGRIAHDFNNLLTSILGNASILLLRLPAESPHRTHVDEIRLASERAADLTRQILSYSGKGTFEARKIDLSEQVREIAPLIQTSLSSAVELRLELHPELPPIEADATQIQQVIMNLVINGAESAIEGNGAVTSATGLATESEVHAIALRSGESVGAGPYVFLEVRDSGVGMAPETQARMFDPFFTTKPDGRGLGLAAVLGIVRSHGGLLDVRSALGEGTTFRALFPAAEGKAASLARREPSADLRGTGLVLVVDDEPAVRTFTSAALLQLGYEVVAAGDGREGVEAFERLADRVAVVVLDMTMPVMSGARAFLEMRRIQPAARVLLVSGYDEAEATRRFTVESRAGFLQKPFTARQLGEKVRELLAGA